MDTKFDFDAKYSLFFKHRNDNQQRFFLLLSTEFTRLADQERAAEMSTADRAAKARWTTSFAQPAGKLERTISGDR